MFCRFALLIGILNTVSGTFNIAIKYWNMQLHPFCETWASYLHFGICFCKVFAADIARFSVSLQETVHFQSLLGEIMFASEYNHFTFSQSCSNILSCRHWSSLFFLMFQRPRSCCWPEWIWSRSCMIRGMEAWRSGFSVMLDAVLSRPL